ncbi:potassium-transporting ATPase subunit F [Devosia sp. A8/3-2]|nr:potassium-transporting ATPase subunit F [Devosia sp. A8/3-2]
MPLRCIACERHHAHHRFSHQLALAVYLVVTLLAPERF